METPRVLSDRYRLGSVIGRGGMGVVWLATDELLDRKVAVKEVSYPPGIAEEEQERLRRRTMREARTTARLSHPNVVGVYDIIEEEGRPWIVMEYVPSRSLGEIVRADGPLSPERTAEVGLQLLEALRAAHAAGVLHRDVKPSNVLIGEDGRVVLGDFGIATAEGGASVTSSGVLIGSPSYMAPERARNSDLGPESDLWALGATLYTAVEGRRPFERDSVVAVLAAVVTEDPDPPRLAGPLWPLIQSLLRRDAETRPDPRTVAYTLFEIANGNDPTLGLADDPAPVVAPPDQSARPDDPAPVESRPEVPVAPVAVPEETGAAVPGETTSRTVGRSRRGGVPVVAGVLAGLVGLIVLGSAGRWLFGGGHAPSRAGGRPSSSPSATGVAAARLPAGFRWYHDRTKFSIGVPDGWTTSHRGHYLYVEDPKSSEYLLIDQTDTPKADPLADWRQQESNRTGTYPGYHRVRLEKVDYPQAKKAADWEFTYNGSHGRTHILNRNVLASSKHAYALYWSTPQSDWSSSRAVFDGFASSFQPAGG